MARTGIQTGAIIARSRNKTINKLRSMETPLVREVWDTSQLAIPRIVGRPDMGCNVALLATCVGLASIIGWQLTALSPLIAPPAPVVAGLHVRVVAAGLARLDPDRPLRAVRRRAVEHGEPVAGLGQRVQLDP